MARNRQRARDRKQKLHRENVPGPLDHASGEVEQAEAAIVAGGAPPAEPVVGVPAEPVQDDDPGVADGGRSGDGAAAAPAALRPGGSRVLRFFAACWAELQRVDWPDRRQVGQATAVVLGFVVVAGAFLGLADVVAQKIVDFIL